MLIRLFLIFICTILFSCNQEEKKMIKIYYYDLDDISTIISVDCNNMQRISGLKELEINDSRLEKLIRQIDFYEIKNNHFEIDTRYKLILEKDTICIEYSSFFIKNSSIYGKANFLPLLKEIIKNNESKSKYVNKPSDKPW